MLVVPSPATETHSTPEPLAPSALRSAVIGAGSTMFISFDDPAVLTTLPPTWTTSGAELEALEAPEFALSEPLEQAANRPIDKPRAAMTVRLVMLLRGGAVFRRMFQASHDR